MVICLYEILHKIEDNEMRNKSQLVVGLYNVITL